MLEKPYQLNVDIMVIWSVLQFDSVCRIKLLLYSVNLKPTDLPVGHLTTTTKSKEFETRQMQRAPEA